MFLVSTFQEVTMIIPKLCYFYKLKSMYLPNSSKLVTVFMLGTKLATTRSKQLTRKLQTKLNTAQTILLRHIGLEMRYRYLIRKLMCATPYLFHPLECSSQPLKMHPLYNAFVFLLNSQCFLDF